VTSQTFADAVRHTKKIEDDFRIQDGYMAKKIPPVVIPLEEDSDSDSSDNYSEMDSS
jgi:hypothetical protein